MEKGYPPNTAGELTYLLTQKVLEYLGDSPDYSMFSSAIGALQCTQLELYRRMVAPYEKKKMKLHGDVYPKEG